MNTTEQQAYKRIVRVRAAGHLSLTDLAFHCGVSDPKMKEWTLLPDFPRPSQPTESTKERRWSKEKVDAWLEAHELEAVGHVND